MDCKNPPSIEHLQFYNQILNGVSGFIIYHFAIKSTDVNLLESNNLSDNEFEDSDNGRNSNSKKTSSPSSSPDSTSPPLKKFKAKAY